MSKLYSLLMVMIMAFNMVACSPGTSSQTIDDKEAIVETDIVEQQYHDPKVTKTNNETIDDVSHRNNSKNGCIQVHFLDVGQADSTFIELENGQTLLIDAGLSGDDVVEYIKGLHYNKIDYVVATHPHDDHIGGMANVLNSFQIGKMYMPKQAHTISAFENMLDVIENKKIDLYTAKSGVNIATSDNLKIDILAPFADNYSNLNNCSAVVKITYGKTIMLFTGDAEQVIETQLINLGIDSDLLKVGHHGAGSSSATSFIKAVSPQIAVISCGKGNSYGHPHADTLAILNQVGADVYRTDEQGTIVVVADQNKKLTVDKKASTIKENAPPIVDQQSSEETQDEPTMSDNQSQVVYRTQTGKKYHRSGCSYLKSKIETTVSEAQAMGLGPCSRCNPPR